MWWRLLKILIGDAIAEQILETRGCSMNIVHPFLCDFKSFLQRDWNRRLLETISGFTEHWISYCPTHCRWKAVLSILFISFSMYLRL